MFEVLFIPTISWVCVVQRMFVQFSFKMQRDVYNEKRMQDLYAVGLTDLVSPVTYC